MLSGGVHDLVGHGVATDDPDRCRFAKVGEGFDKWLKRQAIPGGLTAIWVRERLSGGSAEVVHCHMLQGLANAVCFPEQIGLRQRASVQVSQSNLSKSWRMRIPPSP